MTSRSALDISPSVAPEAGPTLPQVHKLWTWPFVQLLLLQLTFGFSFSTFFLLPKYLEVQLGASPAQIGQVIGSGLFVAVLAVPLVGFSIDHWPRQRMLLLGTLLGASTAFAHCWVSEIGPLLYLLRAAQGLAFLLTFNTAATLAVELAPKARLSQALGLFGVAMLCTNAIAPAIVEPVAAKMSWNAGFGLAGTAAMLAAALALWVPRPRHAKRVSAPCVGWRALLQRRALGICYTTLLTGVGFGSIVTFAQPYALSLGETEVRALFIGYTISAILVRLTLGTLADRLGRHRVAIASLSLYGAVTLTATGLEAGWLFNLGLGLGVAHGLLYPALNAMIVENVSANGRGVVMTAFNGCFNLGFAVSVFGFGALAEKAGYAMVFLVAGILTLSGVVTLSLLPRTPLNDPEI